MPYNGMSSVRKMVSTLKVETIRLPSHLQSAVDTVLQIAAGSSRDGSDYTIKNDEDVQRLNVMFTNPTRQFSAFWM